MPGSVDSAQHACVPAGTASRKSKANKAAATPATDDADFGDVETVKKQPEASEQQELSATGRRKRKDTGTNRAQSRGWSEEEERLFGEALDLHGRDWKAAAAHVGTRDARAFTSHAQKYFIKLAIAGKPCSTKFWTFDSAMHPVGLAYHSAVLLHILQRCIAGKPVPAKVAETGTGYTLSGKPLDPTSAAARAYGLKPEILASKTVILWLQAL